MAGLHLDKQVTPYGEMHALLVRAGVHIRINDVFGKVQQWVESILYSREGAYRFDFNEDGTVIRKLSPTTEIIALCAMAFPQTNEWVQQKISRSLVGKNIIRPSDEYIREHADYIIKNYPDAFPTSNMRILAPRYALYIAAKRAIGILEQPSTTDAQKVICTLPFSVATRQEFPLDLILLDEKFKNVDCGSFCLGIMKRIDQDGLTTDQKSLMMRSVQIMVGMADM